MSLSANNEAYTYTIVNNNPVASAIINYVTIDTNLSEIQHHLDLTGWTPPFDTDTDFQGASLGTTSTVMLTILPSASATFAMRYSKVTSVPGTYSSAVEFFGNVDSIPFTKNINNAFTVYEVTSPVPTIPPTGSGNGDPTPIYTGLPPIYGPPAPVVDPASSVPAAAEPSPDPGSGFDGNGGY